MKRLLVVSGLVAAAAVVPAPAHAQHICVTSGGNPVVCTPHPDIVTIDRPDQICVRVGSSNLVCVF